MQFRIDTTEGMLLALVALALLAALVHIAIGKLSARRERRNIRVISLILREYFRKSGVAVSVGCVAAPSTSGFTSRFTSRFTAFIESEPMKRFRLSHIIEMTLREQVHKTCGLELANVYWRFPIKEATHEKSVAVASAGAADVGNGVGTDENKAAEQHDDYINEGLVNNRDLPKFEVTELPWETFQEAATTQPGKKTE